MRRRSTRISRTCFQSFRYGYNYKVFNLLHQSCLCYEGTRSDMADKFFESMKRCAHMPALKELDPSWSELYSVCAELKRLDPSSRGSVAVPEIVRKNYRMRSSSCRISE